MDEILKKLSEIEITAEKILQNADEQKKSLSDYMEKQRKEFDTQLDQEVDFKIREIRRNLEHEKDIQLDHLRAESEKALQQLNDFYEKNSSALAEELFQKIVAA